MERYMFGVNVCILSGDDLASEYENTGERFLSYTFINILFFFLQEKLKIYTYKHDAEGEKKREN